MKRKNNFNTIQFRPFIKPIALSFLMISELTRPARGVVLSWTSATFSPKPTRDIVLDPQKFDILKDPSIPSDPDPDITNTAILQSFTTEFGVVDTLAGVSYVTNILTDNTVIGPDVEEPLFDSIRNYWAFERQEVNGGDSVTGLDISVGLDNVITLDAFFGTILTEGVPGPGNDIFLTELVGDDSIKILPIDVNGNPIGDFSLSINSGPATKPVTQTIFATEDTGDWGDMGTDVTPFIDFISGSILDDVNLVGVAFDLEDFQGTGRLTNVAGLRIKGTQVNTGEGSIDVGLIGYNTAKLVPEPNTVLGIMFVGSYLFCVKRKFRKDNKRE
ncbi:PEP-CTERM sorting domain-containing protein [Baaleninema simplex]|uniref:PEP-CTERM sorting domain-containing protein n=1 Tax=Baaleninema simplex TaxID=2862350 RepID=UPI00034CBA23|nr:PEP-CTERM sorting domain-containing protein [Baaleninema simplex]